MPRVAEVAKTLDATPAIHPISTRDRLPHRVTNSLREIGLEVETLFFFALNREQSISIGNKQRVIRHNRRGKHCRLHIELTD